ncbi:hypothetical protein [Amycolatopsis kentuckyensis]|uniref:hypothetical protein n=1 Tax=Amycolatopsis kentuckyensis TaxID=218823 RepID=UPI00356B1722
MAARPSTQAVPPASPIAPHIAAVLAGVGAIGGLAALVLLLFVITAGLPLAVMNFSAILAATFACSSCIVWTGQRVIRHQAACYEANRAASKTEIAAALKKVHKEVDGFRAEWQAQQVARVSAAIFEQEQQTRFGVINGGGNGMG